MSGLLIDKFGRKSILLIGVGIDTLVLISMTIFGIKKNISYLLNIIKFILGYL